LFWNPLLCNSWLVQWQSADGGSCSTLQGFVSIVFAEGIPIEDCLAGLLHSLGSCPGNSYRQSELPAFCTCSMSLVVVIWCGSHTGEAYSKTGRTRVVWAVALVLVVDLPRFLLRKPRVLEAFTIVWLMCFVQVGSLLMVTPRYLPLSTTSRVCPCNVHDVWWNWHLPGTLITMHFSGWKHICHFLYFWILQRRLARHWGAGVIHASSRQGYLKKNFRIELCMVDKGFGGRQYRKTTLASNPKRD
jgi:hypothetical protein